MKPDFVNWIILPDVIIPDHHQVMDRIVRRRTQDTVNREEERISINLGVKVRREATNTLPSVGLTFPCQRITITDPVLLRQPQLTDLKAGDGLGLSSLVTSPSPHRE